MEYVYETLRKSECIEGAYERWSQYRKEWTDYILSRMKQQSHIAILGAGECNDVDLKRLLEAGHQVTLLDVNTKAMVNGVKRQFAVEKVSDIVSDNLIIEKCDVWPVTIENYHHVEELLAQQASMSTVIGYLKKLDTKLKVTELELGGTYDWIVVNGLHSQINVIWISILKHYMDRHELWYNQQEVNAYMQMIARMNMDMTHHLQKYLMKAALHQVFAYEYASFSPDDDTIYEIRDLFAQGRADLVAAKGISRVEGAFQWEKILSGEFAKKEIDLKNWRYFIWPFLKEKNYLVVAYECEKIN